MTDYNDVYNKKFEELNVGIFSIKDVPVSEIKKHNPNTEGGFTITNFENDNASEVIILIDSSQNVEIKLCVLFHEYGHALYHQHLGGREINNRKAKSDEKWVIDDEYEAFKNQLIEIYKIALAAGIEILKNMMQRLDKRRISDNDSRYRAALNRLYNEPIWKECMTLIS